MSRSIRIYAVGTETEEPTPPVDIPASADAAVRRCYDEWNKAYAEEYPRKKSDYEAGRAGNKAFREAMPTLAGHDNIRDFIACVAGGMLSEIINANEGAKFLYAAQVASGALNRDTARQKRSS